MHSKGRKKHGHEAARDTSLTTRIIPQHLENIGVDSTLLQITHWKVCFMFIHKHQHFQENCNSLSNFIQLKRVVQMFGGWFKLSKALRIRFLTSVTLGELKLALPTFVDWPLTLYSNLLAVRICMISNNFQYLCIRFVSDDSIYCRLLQLLPPQ